MGFLWSFLGDPEIVGQALLRATLINYGENLTRNHIWYFLSWTIQVQIPFETKELTKLIFSLSYPTTRLYKIEELIWLSKPKLKNNNPVFIRVQCDVSNLETVVTSIIN